MTTEQETRASAAAGYHKTYELVLTRDDGGPLAGVAWVGTTGFSEPEWAWDAIPATTSWQFDAGAAASEHEAREAAIASVRRTYAEEHRYG